MSAPTVLSLIPQESFYAINSGPLVKTLTVKGNAKPWLNIHVLNAVHNQGKRYKMYNRFGKETDKDKFKEAKCVLRLKLKKQHFAGKTAKS